MPDEVKQFYNGAWNMNGAFQFADDEHRGPGTAVGGRFHRASGQLIA